MIFGVPTLANASFFSDLTSMVLGTEVTANEVAPQIDNSVIHNSQNIPLLESSVNPDLKNTNDKEDIVIVQDDSFIYSDGIFGPGPDVSFEKSSISDQINVYTVKEGDTLSGIAEYFNVSVNTIRWENNITSPKISVGQKLNILPVTGVKHVVKKGDTLSKIADKYEAESEDISIFNDISNGDLKQGDIIFVPNGIIKPVVAKPTPSSNTKNPVSTKSSNTKAPSGYYLRPVVGIVTSPYGSRRRGFHPGIDFGNVRGTQIVAAASGVVSKVVTGCKEGKRGCGGGYGNYIDIEHPNGTMTRYGHLSKVNVKMGETVAQGDKIGSLGNTGLSTGPHLHFEIENANGSKMRPPF